MLFVAGSTTGSFKTCTTSMVSKSHSTLNLQNTQNISGPIVRIRPDVLHINDPEFIDPLFGTPGKRRDKYKVTTTGYNTTAAALGTVPHDLHRSRRAALNPFFSKQSVRRLEPVLNQTLVKVLGNLSAAAKSGEPLNIHLLYNAATSDIIYDYCFGDSPNNLDRADLNEEFFTAFHEASKGYHAGCYIPGLFAVAKTLPIRVMAWLVPGVFVFRNLILVRENSFHDIQHEV